jgi:hypothetical protein
MKYPVKYAAIVATGCVCFAAGCEKKERVLDIKAPGIEVEVNKTKDGIEVETERKRGSGVDIEVNKTNRGVQIESERNGDSNVNIEIKKRGD